MSEPYGGPPEPTNPYGQPPQYGQPQFGAPQYGQPEYGQPQYGQPGYPPQYAGNPYGPYPPPYAPYPTASQPTNGLGIGGFVCALVGLVFFWIPFVGLGLAVIGTLLSGLGLAQGTKDSASNGMAIAGLVLGIVAIIPGILWLIYLT